MNPHVWSIRSDATLDAATRIMWNEDVGSLPVVDEWNHPIGMVTDRDIAMSAAINGQPLASLRVAQCMSRQVYACEETDSIEAAAGLMRAQRVRRIPVVDEAQRLVGMLALADLVRATAASPDNRTPAGRPRDAKSRRELADEVLRTLAAICEPRNDKYETEAIVEVQPTKAAAVEKPVSVEKPATVAKAASPAKKPASATRKVGKKKTSRR